MKDNLLKKYILEIIFFAYLLLIGIFHFFKLTNYIFITNIVFFLVLTLCSYYTLGFAKCRKRVKEMIIQTIIIFSLSWYFFTYILGFIIGFLKNSYSFSITNVFYNILPLLIVIVLSELFRYMYVRVKNKPKDLITITVLFVLFDIFVVSRSYSLNTASAVVETFGLLVLPSIAKEVLLTYVTYKSDYIPNIIYRLFFEILVLLVPIVPNFSLYLDSVFKFSFPILILLYLDRRCAKYERRIGKNRFRKSYYFSLPTLMLLTLIVFLVSGIFRYQLVAIGSGSMRPTIEVGDAIIIDKIPNVDFSLLEEGQVIAFKADDKVIVHRINKIVLDKDKIRVITKGDANNDVDNYEITTDNFIGVVNIKIPYIGLPSVWFNSLFH